MDKVDGWLLAFFLFLAFMFGVGIGDYISIGLSYRDAIQHHAAHYDPQTGAFTWNQ